MPPYSTDPILQRIRAQARADLIAERAPLIAERKQLLMELGDPALARAIFGVKGPGGKIKPKSLTKGERAFIQSIADNPYSQLKRIEHDTGLARDQLNEGLSAQGGFFSGYRAEQLGELERGRQLGVTDATRAASRGMRGILTNLARLQRDYNRQIMAAEEAAHQRQLLGY